MNDSKGTSPIKILDSEKDSTFGIKKWIIWKNSKLFYIYVPILRLLSFLYKGSKSLFTNKETKKLPEILMLTISLQVFKFVSTKVLDFFDFELFSNDLQDNQNTLTQYIYPLLHLFCYIFQDWASILTLYIFYTQVLSLQYSEKVKILTSSLLECESKLEIYK